MKLVFKRNYEKSGFTSVGFSGIKNFLSRVMFKHVMLIMLFSITCFFVNAQTIKGRIVDEQSKPLPGASITVKNTFTGTSTDENGEFKLRVRNQDVHLQFSFIGYKSREVEFNTSGNDVNIGDITLSAEGFLTDEVVVRATRAGENIPMAITNLDGAELVKRSPVQDIPYLLELTPSLVATSEAGTGIGYTNFRIRGTDPTRINVTVNGIPLNDSQSHGVFWVNMPDFASSVSSVQIQRGVGTSTNGAAAFGASINFLTGSTSEVPYATASAFAGSFNTMKQNITAGTGIMDNGFSFDVRLSNLKSDGYIRNSFSDHQSFMVSGAWHGENSLIRANIMSGKEVTGISWWGVPAEMLEIDRTYNPAGVYIDPEGNERYYKNQTDNYRQTHYQLLFSTQINRFLDFNSAIHYTRGDGYYEQFRNNDRLSNYGLNPIEIPVPPLEVGDDIFENPPHIITRTDIIRRRMMANDFYGTTMSLNYNKGRLSASTGGAWNLYDGEHFGNIIWMRYADKTEINHEWYNNTGFKTDGNAFVKVNYELIDGLYTYGDLQYRRIDYRMEGTDNDRLPNGNQLILDQEHSFNFFNPKAGLFYRINDNMNTYFSFAVANREPTRTHFKDATGDPNKQPLPEQLFNYELGYEYRAFNYSANINFYYMNYTNQLIPTGEKSSVGYDIMTNVPESFRRGVELIGAVKLLSWIQLDANLTLSQNRIKNFSTWAFHYDDEWNETYEKIELGETDIAYSPNIIGGGRLTLSPINNLNIGIISKYVGEQYFDNTASKDRMLDAYFINDFQIDYTLNTTRIKEIEFRFSVNNIFNVLYSNNAYGGIWYEQGIEGTWAYYYPQAGRNFIGGVTFRF